MTSEQDEIILASLIATEALRGPHGNSKRQAVSPLLRQRPRTHDARGALRPAGQVGLVLRSGKIHAWRFAAAHRDYRTLPVGRKSPRKTQPVQKSRQGICRW